MTLHKDVMLDFAREARTGLDEAVYCAGKTAVHIAEILRQVEGRDGRILLTRLDPEKFKALPKGQRDKIDFDALSQTGYFSRPYPESQTKRVAVVAAGTSDIAVAREASRTLNFYGEVPTEITDVGVAGLWRLLERIEEVRAMKVVIAVAGMDAALPTVVGGLISAPIIGVPTSVGYGVAEGGQTALNAMLASCSAGLTVTNIDNGFGGACAAMRILRMNG